MKEDKTQQQDIEIYVRDIDIRATQNWLHEHFSDHQLTGNSKGDVFRGWVLSPNSHADKIELVILISTAGKAFSSVWFKSAHTPWNSDLECARSYAQTTDAEVRCSPGSWEEGDEQQDNQWWRVTQKGEQLITW